RVAIFQIRSMRFRFLILRLSFPEPDHPFRRHALERAFQFGGRHGAPKHLADDIEHRIVRT
ncbi:hypothetical protein, partial [Mesorhizobium sp.]|uniref:hypothetical protein n=1 Tax=Mesorhizobium sp. TaxID=1871066 RepID=UPI0032AF6B1B